jgi:hypothetical protein
MLDGGRGHKAGSYQPVCELFRNPRRIIDVTLPARHVPDLLCVGQHKFETAFQDMPDRLPVHTRRLHGYM